MMVCLSPQPLKLCVAAVLVREIVVIQYVVHLSEVSYIISYDGSSSENTLGLVQFIHGQSHKKSRKSLDISTLLQGLSNLSSRNMARRVDWWLRRRTSWAEILELSVAKCWKWQ